MKKACIFFCLITIIILAYFIGVKLEPKNTDYLKIGIRANSLCDDEVLDSIKDAVINYLTPYISDAKNKEEVISVIEEHSFVIESLCNALMRKSGIDCETRLTFTKENFSARRYGEVNLPEGEYDVVSIILGDGKGESRWGVVYPTGVINGEKTDIVYKSKIIEFVKSKV